MTLSKISNDAFTDAMNEVERLSDIGFYQESIDKLEIAYEKYEELFECDVNFLDYCALKGRALYKLDLFEEAIDVFDDFVELRPNAPNVIFLRAKCYDYLNWLDDAERDYREVLRIDPTAPAASCFLGMVLMNKEDFIGARAAFETALELDPNDEVSAELLGRAKLGKSM